MNLRLIVEWLVSFHNFIDLNLNPDDMPSTSAALKRLYRQMFNKTKTSPIDSKSYKKLDHIFVNLSLLKRTSSEYQEDIAYERVFDFIANDQNIRRLAFVGEAGVGKTTLLAKIAHDWAVGRHLNEIVSSNFRAFARGTKRHDAMSHSSDVCIAWFAN